MEAMRHLFSWKVMNFWDFLPLEVKLLNIFTDKIKIFLKYLGLVCYGELARKWSRGHDPKTASFALNDGLHPRGHQTNSFLNWKEGWERLCHEFLFTPYIRMFLATPDVLRNVTRQLHREELPDPVLPLTRAHCHDTGFLCQYHFASSQCYVLCKTNISGACKLCPLSNVAVEAAKPSPTQLPLIPTAPALCVRAASLPNNALLVAQCQYKCSNGWQHQAAPFCSAASAVHGEKKNEKQHLQNTFYNPRISPSAFQPIMRFYPQMKQLRSSKQQ